MTRSRRAHRPSAAPALLAALLVAGLGGLVVERRTSRLREAYEAHRLLDDLGTVDNELRWIDGQLDRVTRPETLKGRAKAISLDVRRTREAVVYAPHPERGGPGQ